MTGAPASRSGACVMSSPRCGCPKWASSDAWSRADLAAFATGWDGERVRLLVAANPARADFGEWRYAGACLLPWTHVRELRAEPAGLYETTWQRLWETGDLDLVPLEGPFFDCGTPAEYLAANLAASGGEPVIGPGAVVDGELIRSVVWPGAVVRRAERLVDAVRAHERVTVYVR